MITNQVDDYNSCSEEMTISTKEIYLDNYWGKWKQDILTLWLPRMWGYNICNKSKYVQNREIKKQIHLQC